MTFSLTISAETHPDLLKKLQHYVSSHNMEETETTKAPATRAARAAKAPETKSTDTEKEQTPEFLTNKAKAEKAEAKKEPSISYEQVKELTMKIIDIPEIGRGAVLKLLAKYGVKKADQIDESRWPEYLKEAEAVLKETLKVAKTHEENLA